MEKPLRRQYRFVLFVGLLLWLVGDAIILCFNRMPANDAFNELVMPRGITLWVVLGVVLSGIVEEYIFRGWTTKYKKAILWSLIFQTVCCFWAAGWLVGLAVGILSVCVLFALKHIRHRRLLLIISTSLFFALAHVGRFYAFTWSSLVFIVGTFGFGLVMGYVASCHKLRYAMLIHALFNLSACVLVAYGQFLYDGHDTLSYSDDFVSFEAHRHRQAVSFSYSYSDTLVHYDAVLGGMVQHLMDEYHRSRGLDPDNLHVLYQFDHDPIYSECYDISIRGVSKKLSPADYREVVKTLNDHGLIALDTTFQNLWLLGINNPSKPSGKDTGSYCVRRLMVDLRHKFKMPVFVDTGTTNDFSLPNAVSQCVENSKTWEDCVTLLQPYGIVLHEDSLSKVQVVNVKW